MYKHLTLFVLAVLFSFASYGAGAIIGPTDICVGGPYNYTGDTTLSSVTWSSSNPSVATVTASTPAWMGNVTGVSPGTATITYTSGATVLTLVVTVAFAPTPITGSTTVCVGSYSTLSSGPAGGTWSVSGGSTTISPSGVLMGTIPGPSYVYYHTSPGCYTIATTNTTGPSIAPIAGPSAVCVGSTIPLTDATTGGTWSSSNPSIASISTAGVVTGISAGTVTISYAVTGSCVGHVYYTVTVSSSLTAGTISGTLSTFVGATTSLTAAGGGTWSSTNTSVATINSAGVVTGVAAGTSTISYTVAGCTGPLYTSAVVTVNPNDGISGHINFSYPYSGSVKVWLITYNPTTLMLAAVDSQIVTSTGASAFYQFNGVATDSFRVKAASLTYSGFVPTYYSSAYYLGAYYWANATAIHHISGTSDINKDINMLYGSWSTAGTGFIGGSVTAGANKGTSGGVPVVGLYMYLVEAATGNIVKYVQTDATGSYSFSGIPMNTYFVFPDSLNYVPTPYTGLTLTTTNPSKTGVDFIQHTISKTITPATSGVYDMNNVAANISMYPNPASGKLNICWESAKAEDADLVITDVAGRTVYTTTMSIGKGAGLRQIDLPTMKDGIYMVQLKSENINFTGSLQIQK